MLLEDYVTKMGEAVEYLVAIGSLIGMLGLIVGFALLIVCRRRSLGPIFTIIAISLVLVGICGLRTGVKYFHLYH